MGNRETEAEVEEWNRGSRIVEKSAGGTRMHIITLTAGTGSFHCGTCMRDNALTVALRARGHDALLAPLYLPPVLDEASAAERTPLFYGGINVYLQQKSRLFRKTPRWIDRLLDSPRMLEAAAARAGSGMTTPEQLGELTLSTLRGEEGLQAKELERLTDWLCSEARPDVVCLSNALLIGLARRIRERTGAAVVCTLQGEDSFLDSLPEPHRTQAWETLARRAADCDLFLAVSRYYGDVMRRRARLPEERVRVVPNGILLEGYPTSPRQRMPDPPVLGFLARMCPPKGLSTLVEAYRLLRRNRRIPGLQLHIGGSQTAEDVLYVADLRKRLASEGLEEDVTISPNLDRTEKIAFLQGLSALSVPATYGESFGLYLIESLAAGTPVVQPRSGAFPELVEATGGGLLCAPNDPGALATAVEELLADPEQARVLGETGRVAVREAFSVEQMAEGAEQCFAEAVRRRSGGN